MVLTAPAEVVIELTPVTTPPVKVTPEIVLAAVDAPVLTLPVLVVVSDERSVMAPALAH